MSEVHDQTGLFFWFDTSITAEIQQEEASDLDSEANDENGKSWDEMWIVYDDNE